MEPNDVVIYPRLRDKVVLITGASAGFGEAAARHFAACGSHLIITARRFDRLQKLKEEIESKHKVRIHPIEMDVRDFASVEKGIKGIPAEFQQVDVLVNNAGLALGFAKAHEVSLEHLTTMLDTNVKGIFHMLRTVLPGMIERKRGHVINIGSIAGWEGYPMGSAYNASKFAVEGITESLRKELVDTPLRVSNICPGLAETEFSIVRFGGDKEKARAPYKGLMPLTADDIADLIVYTASRPPHVQIAEVLVFPTSQASATVVHRQQ